MELLLHLLLGPLMLAVAFLMKKYPPKKVNAIYGYRTPRSMKNQNTWEVANQYSTALMVKASLATILFQVFCIAGFEFQTAYISAVIFLIVALVSVIPFTEMYLKKLFDKEGNWKDPYV